MGIILEVLGGTLLPGEGESSYTAQVETERKAINPMDPDQQGLRRGDRLRRGVVRDPDRPLRLRPGLRLLAQYVHPNDGGYRAMADAIDSQLHLLDAEAQELGAGIHRSQRADAMPNRKNAAGREANMFTCWGIGGGRTPHKTTRFPFSTSLLTRPDNRPTFHLPLT